MGWVVLGGVPAAGPLALCMLGGFLIGAVGHLYRSRAAIVVGIVVIALTTAVFVATTDPSLGG
ncbi:MAG: hypothetical protein QOF77_1484 [Solirubrobacteraceae bacterium]|jgi:type IV secretory pathway TrbD component|nr:hypothetical protein [Solirubrobacteraceae bacterium]